jgi:hypothetical protein
MNQILAIFDTINAQKETVIAYAKFAGILVFGLLLISSLFRFIFGKKAQLNHAVSSAVEILCLYVINIVIYSLGLHWKLFLSPLPFMSIEGDYLHIMPVLSSDFSLVCGQVLKVVIIAFVVNILEAFMPKGKRLLSWYFFRLLTVMLAVGANYVVDLLISAFLPEAVFAMAETVLLWILVALVMLGSLKMLTGIALAFLDPIIGALYTFFFANVVGKQISKAVLTTAILAGIVAALHYLGIAAVYIASSALAVYIPFLIILLVLWWLIGKIF